LSLAQNESLDYADALELLGAIAAWVGHESAARVILIKGFAASRIELRPPRSSGDVDVLVAPRDIGRYIEALGAAGWKPVEKSQLATQVVGHSTTVAHPAWPCTLDVHGWFPGLGASADETFDVLWREVVTTELADVDIHVPSWRHNVLILAANGLRARSSDSRALAELKFLRRRVLAESSDATATVADAALETGSECTLSPFLESLGPSAAAVARREPQSDVEVDWWRRLRGDGSMAAAESGFLLSQPLRLWPRTLARLIWPPAEEVRLEHPDVDFTEVSVSAFRLARLRRGLSDLLYYARHRDRDIVDEIRTAIEGDS
jgi:hypothetical protein